VAARTIFLYLPYEALQKLMIIKRKDGYVVVSKSGKRLGGPYSSKKGALKRLRQVEYFKNK
jgi:hypothetical protein